MTLSLCTRWNELHWQARASALAVIAAVLLWQSRHTWSIANPTYGWPICFSNVPHENRPEWQPLFLLCDIIVWLLLAGSAVHAAKWWKRRAIPYQFSLAGFMELQAVVAVLFAVGCTESYFRSHYDSGSLMPRFCVWKSGETDVWFDVGLFTDPPSLSLPRIILLLAVASAIYMFGKSSFRLLRSIQDAVMRRRASSLRAEIVIPGFAPSACAETSSANKDTVFSRAVVWALVILVAILSIATLPPPTIH
jgi:hypothetical protein